VVGLDNGVADKVIVGLDCGVVDKIMVGLVCGVAVVVSSVVRVGVL
jgi:hypothetical protein